MKYEIAKLELIPEINAEWNKPPWTGIQPLRIEGFMGSRPEHFPGVQAKLAYDREALYAIFRVEDNYVRAVAQQHQGPVCRDSCVEFFFTPGDDPSAGYFNLEMNCGGTMLFHFQKEPRKNPVSISEEDITGIRIAHTLPRIVEPEIAQPVVWTVEYTFPLAILQNYSSSVAMPEPGRTWRANFYKCADKTSHPHWLTWAPVEHPTPNFHLPRCFGDLEFQ
jgi:hypothetical protein